MLDVFKAWVPTVSGKLSFRIIGETSHPERCVSSNILVGSHRYIVCYQRRNLSDKVIPGFFGRYLSGDFRFVFVARVKQDYRSINLPLYGHVFMIQDLGAWRETIRPTVRRAQAQMMEYQQNLVEQEFLEQRVIHSILETLDALYERSVVSVNVILQRTGELALNKILSRKREFVELSSDLKIYANVSVVDLIAAQLYYFVRDIVHTHQHHAKRTDTIITAYRTTNDIDWRKAVLFSLYNHIVARKRSNNIIDNENALGILAYASTFFEISRDALGEKGLWAANEKNFPTFRDNQLTASIVASIRRLSAILQTKAERRQARWNRRISWVGVTLTILGLLYAFGGDAPIENSTMACTIKVARQNIFLVFPILVFLYVIYALSVPTVEFREWRIVRNATRLALVLPRRMSFGILLAVGLVVSPLLWYFINQLVAQGDVLSEINSSITRLVSAVRGCFA